MRTYIRLLAPLSILATALYLAFLASSRAESNSFPISTVDNQNANFVPPARQAEGKLAVDKVKNRKSKKSDGTDSGNHP